MVKTIGLKVCGERRPINCNFAKDMTEEDMGQVNMVKETQPISPNPKTVNLGLVLSHFA